MGCTSTKSGIGLDGTSTKVWLHIEDVAASVQAFPRKDGSKGLTVVVAGMDKKGLFGVLERSFRHRGLGIESGGWALKGCLFHATFHLSPVVKESCDKVGIVRKLHTELCVAEATSSKILVHTSQAALSLLKVDVEHTMGEELHVGLVNLIQEYGGRTVRGALHRVPASQDSAEQVDQDSLWVDCHDMKRLMLEVFSSLETLQQRLRMARMALEEINDKKSVHSKEVSIVDTNTSDSLLNALRLADRTALQKLVLELPVAVMDRVAKTPYGIKPTSWGYQAEGFQKYMGTGIILEDENDGAPVVQFTTLLIQNKNVAHVGPQKLRRSLAYLGVQQYGEFVNSIDVNRQRFTIERVFLNKVCPSGNSIGSIVSAEQLFAPVWEKGVSGLGELLPVHKIREIKISDVVNWNTYAVISIALIERGERNDTFGEHFQAALNGELETANLTRDACKSLPLVEVVLQTVLGKLVNRILKLWYKRTSVCLTCTGAEVTFRSGSEIIAGEARAAMDVIFQVRVEYGASLEYSEALEPSKSVARQESLPKTLPASAAEIALHQWVEKIKASGEDMDHGFGLGKVGIHDMVHEQSTLLAVTRGIRSLQQERAWSCRAVADGLDEDTAEGLSKQRNSTDEALVDALHLTTSPAIRAVSTSLILLRTVVDQNLNSESPWQDRYKLVCADPRAFNMLVGTLVEWLTGACKMHPDIPDSSSESLILFCYFGEQLGRERGFVLTRGRRPSDCSTDQDGMKNLVLMLATRNLIGDLLQINARFATVFRQLDEAESRFMADDEHDPQNWFSVISLCIDLVQRLIDDLIGSDCVRQEDSKQLLACCASETLVSV